MSTRAALVCRWGARAVGLLPLWFVGAHLAGDGFPDLTAASPLELTLFACLSGALVGLVLLWRWELYGGLLNIVSVSAFVAVFCLSEGRVPGVAFLPLVAPGVLAVAAGLLSRPHSPPPRPTGRPTSATL